MAAQPSRAAVRLVEGRGEPRAGWGEDDEEEPDLAAAAAELDGGGRSRRRRPGGLRHGHGREGRTRWGYLRSCQLNTAMPSCNSQQFVIRRSEGAGELHNDLETWWRSDRF
jgi:hypothetical protein